MKLIFAVLAAFVFIASFQKNPGDKPVKITSSRGVTILTEDTPHEYQANQYNAANAIEQAVSAAATMDQIIARAPAPEMPISPDFSSPAMTTLRQSPANAATEYIPVL